MSILTQRLGHFDSLLEVWNYLVVRIIRKIFGPESTTVRRHKGK